MRLDLSTAFLVLSNLVPILGVFFLGWSVASILILYWLESLIIGALNVIKVMSAPENFKAKFFISIFFIVHYGIFTAVHGMFLMEMFDIADLGAQIKIGGALFVTALSFLISHSVSMLINFYGKGEYLRINAGKQIFAPYGRVIVMHIVIIIGGALIQYIGEPIAALIVLIAVKIWLDIRAHNKSHAAASVITT